VGGAHFTYVGRFAPSPTGALHAGSLVAALASWLDARAWNDGRGGRWLVRIEDLDSQRCVAGAAERILRQLQDCHLQPDQPPVYQSQRTHLYQRALTQLVDAAMAYPCACSRKDIEAAIARQAGQRERHGELVYPGTCSAGLRGRPARAWRFRSAPAQGGAADPTRAGVTWRDRRLGLQQQDVADAVGDFVIRRSDAVFAYQLAVVVDDDAQQVSHVVRGEDLADNTPRQLLLQQALGMASPRYLHSPLVRAASGEKLSKQHGAVPLDTADPMAALNAAADVLGLGPQSGQVAQALHGWVQAWRHLYNPVV